MSMNISNREAPLNPPLGSKTVSGGAVACRVDEARAVTPGSREAAAAVVEIGRSTGASGVVAAAAAAMASGSWLGSTRTGCAGSRKGVVAGSMSGVVGATGVVLRRQGGLARVLLAQQAPPLPGCTGASLI